MSLFCKRQSYLPNVVLPRPAWQEKAHCVAAGSFFYFHIYHFLCLLFICRFLLSYLLHFISIILMQAPSIDISVLTSMASFPSVDHFMFPKFHLFLFFRDTFSSFPRSWPVSKSRQECRSRLRLDKSPPQLGLSHTEVGQSYRMKTFFKSMFKQADLRPSLEQVKPWCRIVQYSFHL